MLDRQRSTKEVLLIAYSAVASHVINNTSFVDLCLCCIQAIYHLLSIIWTPNRNARPTRSEHKQATRAAKYKCQESHKQANSPCTKPRPQSQKQGQSQTNQQTQPAAATTTKNKQQQTKQFQALYLTNNINDYFHEFSFSIEEFDCYVNQRPRIHQVAVLIYCHCYSIRKPEFSRNVIHERNCDKNACDDAVI